MLVRDRREVEARDFNLQRRHGDSLENRSHPEAPQEPTGAVGVGQEVAIADRSEHDAELAVLRNLRVGASPTTS
jgi:hypothetical protein